MKRKILAIALIFVLAFAGLAFIGCNNGLPTRPPGVITNPPATAQEMYDALYADGWTVALGEEPEGTVISGFRGCPVTTAIMTGDANFEMPTDLSTIVWQETVEVVFANDEATAIQLYARATAFIEVMAAEVPQGVTFNHNVARRGTVVTIWFSTSAALSDVPEFETPETPGGGDNSPTLTPDRPVGVAPEFVRRAPRSEDELYAAISSTWRAVERFTLNDAIEIEAWNWCDIYDYAVWNDALPAGVDANGFAWYEIITAIFAENADVANAWYEDFAADIVEFQEYFDYAGWAFNYELVRFGNTVIFWYWYEMPLSVLL